MDQVRGGEYKRWSAVDLTPGPHGLAEWSATDIAAYLTTGKNGHVVAHGPMNEVIASTRQLRPGDAAAIGAYLRGISPGGERPIWTGRSPSGAFKSKGEKVYTVHCGTCHLPDGKGDRILGVSLANNALVQAPDPSSLINVILYGPELPPPPFTSGRTRMPGFGKRLSDEDIAAVTSYLRSNFGNRASSVSSSQVGDQR